MILSLKNRKVLVLMFALLVAAVNTTRAQCNLTLQSSPAPPAISCTFSNYALNAGFYTNLSVPAGTYLDFAYNANACGNTSGMCLTTLNGTGSSGNFSNVAGFNTWFTGTTSSVRLSTFRTGAPNGCSALVSYRYSTPASPAFTVAPTSICQNGNYTYSINAVAAATTYTWSVAGVAGTIVSGQGTTSAVISFTGNGTATVRVIASNAGRCNSAVAVSPNITVAGATISPSTSICTGNVAHFSAVVTGGDTSSRHYQWQSSADQITWMNVGANTPTYTTDSLTQSTYYRLIFSYSGMPCDSFISSVSLITVYTPTVEVTGAGTFCLNSLVRLEGSLSNAPATTLGEHWERLDSTGWVSIPGTYEYIAPTNVPGTFTYRTLVYATAVCPNPFISPPADVIVVDTLRGRPDAEPATLINCSNFRANWSALAGAAGYFIDVATNDSFTAFATGWNNAPVGMDTTREITGLAPGTTYYYRVRAANACGTTLYSDTIAATTVTGITVLSQPTDTTTLCRGDSTILAVSAIGGTSIFYQWQFNNAGTWVSVSNGLPADVTYTGGGSAILQIRTGALTSSGIYAYRTVITPGDAACTGDTSAIAYLIVNTPPQITACPGNVFVNADDGLCGAVVTYADAEVTGSPAPDITYSQNSGTEFPVGTTTVTVIAANACGSDTCYFDVTVTDSIPPTALCRNITAYLDATGNASITAAMVNNGSFDNCAIAGYALSTDAFTCADTGENEVTLTVTDVNGLQATCIATVTVLDTTPPQAVCTNITVYLNNSGSTAINAGQVNNGSTDACGIAAAEVSPNTFSCSNIGDNQVTLTVTDVNGNTGTCQATVTVLDTTAPVAACQNITVYLDASGNAAITGSNIDNGSTDNCGIAGITVSPDAFDCSNIGSNGVTLMVTDVNGNTSTCSATVTVADTTAPSAICRNVTVYLDAAGHAAITAAQVNNGSTDACGIASISASPDTFTCSNTGSNSVTLTVTDVNGNQGTCTATVTVLDTIKPVANCKNASVTLSGGTVTVTPAQVNNGSSDNCGIATLSVSPNTFNCADIGNHTVTLTATDASGNVSTCQSTVTVNGAVPTCSIEAETQSIFSVNTTNTLFLGLGPQSCTLNSSVSGGTSFTYSWTGSNLSCYTCADPVFTPTAPGNYTFTLTVTNNYGCVTTCQVTVCVLGVIVPGSFGLQVYVCHVPSGGGTPTTITVSTLTLALYLVAHPFDHVGACVSTCFSGKTDGGDAFINSEAAPFEVLAYPNPFTNQFNIRVETTATEDLQINIYDVTGQLLEQHRETVRPTGILLGDHLAAGIYLVEVKQNADKQVIRLVKSE